VALVREARLRGGLGDREAAVPKKRARAAHAEAAPKDGFGPRDVLERDEDLAPLRGNPRFATILSTIGARKPAPNS
jgi:hypothetical protein